MPRKMRVRFPGAMDHVISSDDQRDDIFFDDVDRLLSRSLAEACQKTDWQVHAFCLMGNGPLRCGCTGQGKRPSYPLPLRRQSFGYN
jgi:hypothetical protein